MKTKFAPDERVNFEELSREKKIIESIDQFKDIINALPYVAAILNSQRQIIFSNDILIESTGGISLDEIIGKRPGEVLNCVNSRKEEGGCGASDNCRVCGVVNAVLESQISGQKVKKECRITSDNNETHYDLLVTSTPFYWNKEKFTILTLTDISDEKRRKALEKIFFHDIINKAGSLSGFLDILKDIKDTHMLKEYLQLAGRISDELTEEILSQRSLLAAESGDLEIDSIPVLSLEFLKNNVNSIMFHQVAKNKFFEIDNRSVNITFRTDEKILRRIITNMMKNALEASDEIERIVVGCELKGNIVTFWVHNNKVMPYDIQLQVFQRSFSTKGTNRGLGTYSIKLLGEKYLKGKVYFKTEENFGTRFYIDLPVV